METNTPYLIIDYYYYYSSYSLAVQLAFDFYACLVKHKERLYKPEYGWFLLAVLLFCYTLNF